MMIESRNSGTSKHVSAATNKRTTIEDVLEAVFSILSLPILHNKDTAAAQIMLAMASGNLPAAQSVLNCIVNSHYLSTTIEQKEDLLCALVIVIHRVCKSVTDYKRPVNPVINPNPVSSN
jgi:hypothetical protein